MTASWNPGCPRRRPHRGKLPRSRLVRGTISSPEPLSEILTHQRYDTGKTEEFLRHYDRAFAHFRKEGIVLMEPGVKRGGLRYLWRDCFTRGTVVGIEIELPADFADTTGRCRMFQCDQGDAPLDEAYIRDARMGC